jgi:hypothetical protein
MLAGQVFYHLIHSVSQALHFSYEDKTILPNRLSGDLNEVREIPAI